MNETDQTKADEDHEDPAPIQDSDAERVTGQEAEQLDEPSGESDED